MGDRYSRAVAATKTPTHSELAWAAGFYEGEGCATAHGPSSYHPGYPRLEIVQVQREPLERMQQYFGGAIRSFVPARPNNQPSHIWRVNGPRAIGVMMTLYAWLSPRRKDQFKKVFSAWRSSEGRIPPKRTK